MSKTLLNNLSRRERQIMDIIYRKGSATAAEVMEALQDPLSYSAIRTFLRILEEKDFLIHKQDGPRYLFFPKVSVETARRSVVKNMLDNFFNSSPEDVVATLLDVSRDKLTSEDFDRLQQLIEQEKNKG